MKVLKFEKSGCSPCKLVESYLKNKSVYYDNIDIETTDEFDLLIKYNIRNVPTTLLIDNEGVIKEKIVGFNEESLNLLINKYNNA